ncbi:MAG: tetratricopeptide repeat protein [Eudoraea sp.]|nr:tetratricopeptide repeat protein [Eudoraea sp.]
MRKKDNITIIFACFFSLMNLAAQEREEKALEKAYSASQDLTYEANDELVENDFNSAEAKYRRAISKSDSNSVAPYNLGNSYYNRESFGEAFGRYKMAGERTKERPKKHKAFHNMGNVFMKNKEYAKAVESYKEALRNNPDDDETRYNLALAKKMLEQDKQNQNQDDKEDQKDQKDQKDKNEDQQSQGGDDEDQQEQQDQKEENQGDDKEEEQNKKDEGKDQKDQEQKEQKQQPQPRPNQLSEQQIKNLLEAMQNEEKKVQEKMEAKKIKGPRIKNEKDW